MRYFCVQLVASGFLEMINGVYGWHSHAYAVAWVIMDACVVASMAPVAWEAFREHPAKLVALGSAFLITAAYAGAVLTKKPFTFDGIANLADASCLLFAGLLAGFGIPYLKGTSKRIAFSLMFLWVSQAAYQICFTLNITSHAWKQLNEFLPTMIVAAGCLWLAWFTHVRTPEVTGGD